MPADSPQGSVPQAPTSEEIQEIFSNLTVQEPVQTTQIEPEFETVNESETGCVNINSEGCETQNVVDTKENNNNGDNVDANVEVAEDLRNDLVKANLSEANVSNTSSSQVPVQVSAQSVEQLYPVLDQIECTEAVEIDIQTVNINDLNDTVDPCEEAVPTAPAKTDSGVFFSLIPGQVSDQRVSRLDEVAEDVTRTSLLELTHILQRIRSPQCRISQISSLYSNLFVENCEAHVKEFLGSVKSAYDGYELYELLCNYQRAFNQLGICEKSLYELREQFSNCEKTVWTISSETISEEATCKDENNVEATHQYHSSKFNQDAFLQLERSLKQMKELTKDSFSLYTYSVQLCCTQVDHFFYKTFSHINLQSFQIQGYPADYPNEEVASSASNLRKAISTLLIFARKATLHPSFLNDCKRWLSNCVGLLLRIATLNDHLFILNHALRIPPGHVNKWACSFVQIPKIPIPNNPSEYFGSFSHIYLDYALAALNLILKPVDRREDFLKQHEAPYKLSGANESIQQWVVIDSDGEDDPEDATFFKESDLIALLHQVAYKTKFAETVIKIYVVGLLHMN